MRVYVVGKNRWCGPSTATLFAEAGWTVVGDEILSDKTALRNVDLVVFTGGADISPHLYGEDNISSTVDAYRDQFELDVFHSLSEKQAKAGICRGAQLLNVLNGGSLIQHHGHMGGYKKTYGYVEGKYPKAEYKGEVDACHHQGILCPSGHELMWIDWKEYKEGTVDPTERYPVYAFAYPDTNTMGVQWHPEWGHGQSRKIFFDLLKKYTNSIAEAA